MAAPYGDQIHFACEFDLTAVPGRGTAWSDVIKVIRSWIARKTQASESLGGRWFYGGGKWKPQSGSRVLVATEQVQGKGTDTSPQFWAVRYEHPCDDVHFRQWRTDMGVSVVAEGQYRVALVTTHWILAGYIGQEPAPPVPTSPAVVTMMLKSRLWAAAAGSERLQPEAVALLPGQAAAFERRLTDPRRRCPIILVSRDSGSGQPKVDVGRLARLLSGAATVQVTATPGIDPELEWFLPRGFRCAGGTLRVYQAPVRFDVDADAKRHRFFTPEQIDLEGATVVEDMIIRGLVRRSKVFTPVSLVSVDDVTGKRRELRLEELRKSAGDQSLQELVDLQAEYVAELEREKVGLTEKVAALEADLGTADDELAALGFEKDHFQATAAEAEARVRLLEQQSDRAIFATLPASLLDVVDRIQLLWPDRIVFTERARSSAKRATFTDLGVAWKCLWSTATVLHDLVFGPEGFPGTLEQAFLQRSGFELSLTEGKQTKHDKKLMAARKLTYKGAEIDITPHVKYGSKEPKCLRVHYHADNKEQLIVVGHCGDHLNTYGSGFRH